MAILDKAHNVVGKTERATVDDPIALQVRADDKEAAPGFASEEPGFKDEKPAENVQSGVQKIEAVTLAWSKSSVYVLLVLYVHRGAKRLCIANNP